MARIDHSFQMTQAPADAQALFVRDIAPEMARDRGFLIARESPGELLFSDGVAPGRGVDEASVEDTEAPVEPEDVTAAPGLDAALQGGGGGAAPLGFSLRASGGSAVEDDLPFLFSRHVHVDFTAEGEGTQVRIHGHLERGIAHALERLGAPGQWPETADLPHD